jgi:hypothetical protein
VGGAEQIEESWGDQRCVLGNWTRDGFDDNPLRQFALKPFEAGIVAPRREDGSRDQRTAAGFTPHIEAGEPFGMRERQRTDQHRVDDGEHGRRESNGCRQHHNSQCRCCRPRAQAAEHMTRIDGQFIEPPERSGVVC